MPLRAAWQSDVKDLVKSRRVKVVPKNRQLVVSPPTDHVGHPHRGQVARPGAIVGDRARPRRPVPLLVGFIVPLVFGTAPNQGHEALRPKVGILVGDGITRDEFLETGDELDRVRPLEFEGADIDQEAQKPLEIGLSQSRHSREDTPNGE